jgi:hypothetical protein
LICENNKLERDREHREREEREEKEERVLQFI